MVRTGMGTFSQTFRSQFLDGFQRAEEAPESWGDRIWERRGANPVGAVQVSYLATLRIGAKKPGVFYGSAGQIGKPFFPGASKVVWGNRGLGLPRRTTVVRFIAGPVILGKEKHGLGCSGIGTALKVAQDGEGDGDGEAMDGRRAR